LQDFLAIVSIQNFKRLRSAIVLQVAYHPNVSMRRPGSIIGLIAQPETSRFLEVESCDF